MANIFTDPWAVGVWAAGVWADFVVPADEIGIYKYRFSGAWKRVNLRTIDGAVDISSTYAGALVGLTGTVKDVLEGIDSFIPGSFNVGNPGTESASVKVNGVDFESISKVNHFGGSALHAEFQIHRHSLMDSSDILFTISHSDDETHGNVIDGKSLGRLDFCGWHTNSYWLGAIIGAVVDGTPGATDMPTSLFFSTSPEGSATPVQRMWIKPDGRINIINALPTLRLENNVSGTWDNLQVLSAIESYTDDASGDGPIVNAALKFIHGRTGTAHANADGGIGFYTANLGSGLGALLRALIDRDGNMGIATDVPTEKLHITGNLFLNTDSNKLLLGAGKDMSAYYDGADGHIKTNEVAASDLVVSCGTDKTLELEETVWKDLWVGLDAIRVSGTSYLTMIGNIREIVFSNNDYADFPSIEAQHDWKEGTDLSVHLHIATRGTNASAYHVRYTIEYSWADVDEVFPATTTLDVEFTIPGGTAAVTHLVIPMGTISGSGHTIASQIKFRLDKEASASSDAPAANNPYVLQIGFHYECDTVGSRQLFVK